MSMASFGRFDLGGHPITDGVHRIDTPLGDRVCSVVLFVGGDCAVLYDTGVDGTVSEYVVPYLARLGVSPQGVHHIVISHCDVDHFGGVCDAHDCLPSARIAAHEMDADAIGDYDVYERDRARGFIEPYGVDEDPEVLAWARSVTCSRPVDDVLHGGESIDIGGRTLDVLHVPGHSRGHLAIFDRTEGVLAIADAALGRHVPLADGRAAFPPTYRYLDDYRTSISLMSTLGAAQVLAAHEPTFSRPAAAEFFTASLQFTGRLDKAVFRVLAASPATLAEVLAQVNGSVGDWPVAGTAKALAFPVAAHLERGVAHGTVRVVGSRDGGALFGVVDE